MTAQELEEARRAFFERIPEACRNVLAQLHHQAVRTQQAKTPADVQLVVRLGLRRRCESRWEDESRRGRWREVLETLAELPDLWTGYCEYILAYEAMPQAERDRLKDERGQQYRDAAMDAKEPTEKQLAYLRSLGDHGAPPETMGEASRRIDAILRRQQAAR